MKFIIAGGTGLLGTKIRKSLESDSHEIVLLSRSASNNSVQWDGKTLGPWADEIDGADVVINLAGRSINCRLTDSNKQALLDSRLDTTRVIGQAIAAAQRPPRLWLQASAATIYTHHADTDQSEANGVIGDRDNDVPKDWLFLVDLIKQWEAAQHESDTPGTRKIAMRISMVMSPDPDGAFEVMSGLVRKRLGGPVAGGKQYVSWIHEVDFVRAVRFLIENQEIEGPVNLTAPDPLPQRDFMRALRDAWNVKLGLPAAGWMTAIGAFLMGSNTELVLKSRRVVPGKLRDHGFRFEFPEWPAAAVELVARYRQR